MTLPKKLTEYSTEQLERLVSREDTDASDKAKIQTLLDIRSRKRERLAAEKGTLDGGHSDRPQRRPAYQSLRDDGGRAGPGTGSIEQYVGASSEEPPRDDAGNDGHNGNTARLPGINGHDHGADSYVYPGATEPRGPIDESAATAWRLQRGEPLREGPEPGQREPGQRRGGNNPVKKKPELSFAPVKNVATAALGAIGDHIPTVTIFDADVLSKKETESEDLLDDLTDCWMDYREYADQILTAINRNHAVANVWHDHDEDEVRRWCKALLRRSRHSRFAAGVVRESLDLADEVIFFVMPLVDAWQSYQFLKANGGLSMMHARTQRLQDMRPGAAGRPTVLPFESQMPPTPPTERKDRL